VCGNSGLLDLPSEKRAGESRRRLQHDDGDSRRRQDAEAKAGIPLVGRQDQRLQM
jgi:hypothetical protein